MESRESQLKLGERYYVGERTIRDDLREIREGCLNAFGQTIDIEYDLNKKELYSTPVPIFLVHNITQIVAMLNGLGIMAKDPRYQSYAINSALTVWKQLAPDVKNRIMNDLIDMLQLNREWYESLEEQSKSFILRNYTERMFDSTNHNVVRYYKNGEVCDIYYFSNNNIVNAKKVRITDCRPDYFEIRGDGIEEKLEYCNIVDIRESGN